MILLLALLMESVLFAPLAILFQFDFALHFFAVFARPIVGAFANVTI